MFQNIYSVSFQHLFIIFQFHSAITNCLATYDMLKIELPYLNTVKGAKTPF